jgi:hypothetical protein
MTDTSARWGRRTLLATAAATTAALAGCAGNGGEGTEPPTTETEAETETDDDAVPAAYETATSLNGRQRDPDGLASKEALNYQAEPEGDQQCSNCGFYIEDKNGDGLGACTLVAGTIDPEGWCTSYAPYSG